MHTKIRQIKIRFIDLLILFSCGFMALPSNESGAATQSVCRGIIYHRHYIEVVLDNSIILHSLIPLRVQSEYL